MPSRHAHVIISLGEPIEVLRMPDPRQPAGRLTALVTGLHDAPATVATGVSLEGIHVFVRPFGVRAVLGVPVAELALRVVDLADLRRPHSAEFMERLGDATTWPARFAVLDDEFTRLLHPIDPDSAIVWAWRRLAVGHGRGSVAGLARAIGWSRPHLSSRFRDELGVTPKTAARVFRFGRACRLIKATRPRLAEVAAHCGYSDQAHMTREWQALAGRSPREWIARELPFIQDYELAGSDDGMRVRRRVD